MTTPRQRPSGETDPAAPDLLQDPVAYLVGLQGVALLRACAGEHGPEFMTQRLVEIAELLRRPAALGEALPAQPLSVVDGYDEWSSSYDGPGNALLDWEIGYVKDLVSDLPPGRALDAGCGSGRHAQWLAQQGFSVTGVDTSPKMLALARQKLPQQQWLIGDFEQLEAADDSFDLVVCALALTHRPDPAPAITEFARVLAPGGTLVVSDTYSEYTGSTRYPLVRDADDGSARYLPGWNHSLSAYLQPALAAGLELTAVHEPRSGPRTDPNLEPIPTPPGAVPNRWLLHTWYPAAVNAAYQGQPSAKFLRWKKSG